jgi:hypothetical protein
MLFRTAVAPAFALVMSACANAPAAQAPSAFEAAIAPLCGKAFEGRIVSTDTQDDLWRAERLVMHVRGCEPGLVQIPLHVGDDHSRTWVLMQVGAKWELRHDHRHEDGEPDTLTQYGGFSTAAPDALRQEFPADEATKALFDAEDIAVSKTNVWAVEIDPGASVFAYELKRPERFLRVEFDTAAPVAVPPAPWGWAE